LEKEMTYLMAIFAICGIVAMLVAILLFNPIGISNKSAKKRKTTSITLVLIASVSLTFKRCSNSSWI
jgi:hypothetical protein